MLDSIKPLKPVKNVLPKHYWGLDVETEGGLYGKAVLICCVKNDGTEKVFEGHDAAEQLNEWLDGEKWRLIGNHFFIHNMEFDLSKIFGNLLDHPKFKLFQAGSRFITAKYCARERTVKKVVKKEYIHFSDTFNLSPNSLSDIGKSLDYEKFKMPKKLLNLNYDKDGIDQTDIDYCLRDCKIILKYVESFGDMLNDFDVKIKLTAASNAKAIWNRMSVKKTIYINTVEDQKFRDAIYGGRTEVIISEPRTRKLYYYDVNSMYASVMKYNRFPDPSKLKTYTHIPIDDFKDILYKYEGMADITFKAPYMHIPVLPTRKHNIVFGYGKINGCYCYPDIRLAIENGYEITELKSTTLSAPIDSPFKDYVEYFEKIKIDATNDEDKAMRSFAKGMLNNFWGKFAQRNDVEQRLVDEIPDAGVFFSISGDKYELTSVEKVRARGTVVCWAAYVASYARCLLYDYLKVSPEDIYYCDTDSMVTSKPLPDYMISDTEFGKMEIVGIIEESYFIDPKKYIIKMNGINKVVIKGITRTETEHLTLVDMNCDAINFEYTKPVKSKTALVKGVLPYSEETINETLIRHSYPKRVYNNDGSSLPIMFD